MAKYQDFLERLSLDNSFKPMMEDFIAVFGDRFPLLSKYKDTIQDPIWHAEGDVHIHTDMVLSEVYKILDEKDFTERQRLILILSALFHDYAKPITTYEKDGRIKASKHEEVGMNLLVLPLMDLNLNNEVYIQILNLVGFHQKPKLLVLTDAPDHEYYALMNDCDLDLLYYLEVADMKGRTAEDTDLQLLYLEEFYNKGKELSAKMKEEYEQLNFKDQVIYRNWGDFLLASGEIQSPFQVAPKVYEQIENHFEVIMMVGLPGVGKSTFIKRHYSDTPVISLDDIREELSDRSDQSNNSEVVRIAKERFKEYLRKKQSVIWDATNIRKDYREPLLQLARNYGAYTTILVLLDKEKNILTKNKDRKDVVPDNVIERMINRYQLPSYNEAHKVYYYNVGTEYAI